MQVIGRLNYRSWGDTTGRHKYRLWGDTKTGCEETRIQIIGRHTYRLWGDLHRGEEGPRDEEEPRQQRCPASDGLGLIERGRDSECERERERECERDCVFVYL